MPRDTSGVADAVAAAVSAAGRPVARVRAGDFLHPRSVRLEHGADDPDAGYERWVDHQGLRREVLDPMGPGGALTWLPTLRDPLADRATRALPVHAVPGTVVVVDGPFLLRWETADAFDLSVHLDVSPAALGRRLPASDVTRVTGAWELYTSQTRPADRADLVVRYDRPAHPAVALS